jgi:hypothetical protein
LKQDKVRFKIVRGTGERMEGVWHITLLEGQAYTICSHLHDKWESIEVVSVERDKVESK